MWCRPLPWKSLIDAARDDPVLIDATRAAQIPLLRGALVLCVKSNHSALLKFVDRFHNRDLPPFSGLPPDRPHLMAWSGRIFVWAGWSLTRYHIFKLDVGCGDWHWQQVIISDWFNPIVLGSKIYVSSPKLLDMAVFDMESHECDKIPMWDCSSVGSVVSPLGVEDLYGFRDGDAGLVEVVRYDRISNSWSTQESITRPSLRSFMVVNGSCFEPAIETGTNVLYRDCLNKPLWWHNSTVFKDEEWIPIQCEVRHALAMAVRRGSLYGIDRKTLCKGKIVVESKHLIWEPLVYVSDALLDFTTMA